MTEPKKSPLRQAAEDEGIPLDAISPDRLERLMGSYGVPTVAVSPSELRTLARAYVLLLGIGEAASYDDLRAEVLALRAERDALRERVQSEAEVPCVSDASWRRHPMKCFPKDPCSFCRARDCLAKVAARRLSPDGVATPRPSTKFYVALTGDRYYPQGGPDVVGVCGSEEEAVVLACAKQISFAQVVEVDGEVVTLVFDRGELVADRGELVADRGELGADRERILIRDGKGGGLRG
jgi:hypothetical protein